MSCVCIGCLFCCFCCGAFSFRHGRVLVQRDPQKPCAPTNKPISLFFFFLCVLFFLLASTVSNPCKSADLSQLRANGQPVIKKIQSLSLFWMFGRTLTIGLATDNGQPQHSVESAITGIDVKFGEPSITHVGPWADGSLANERVEQHVWVIEMSHQ